MSLQRIRDAAHREEGGVLVLWAILTPGMIFLFLLVVAFPLASLYFQVSFTLTGPPSAGTLNA
jgi:hypothetical protein